MAMWAACSMAACRHQGDFRIQYNQMRGAMINGDWVAASQQLESSKERTYKEDDRVMYWLNLGTVQHYAGNAKASSENLVRAEEAMQDLFTKSITSEASKFLVSDTLQAYEGEDFEKVLVYLYTALNHVNLGRTQDALVEVRRADELLKKMLVHYEKEGEVGTLYKQDAFMLWLVGLFYEMEGASSLNDALLAYKAAYRSYREDYAGNYGVVSPRFVAEDILRVATTLGRDDEVRRIAEQSGATGQSAENLSKGLAEVVIIHGTGEAPFKEEFFIDGIMPDQYVLRIALPRFVAVPFRIRGARIRSDVGGETVTEVAEPVTEMVLKNFEHRLPAIKLRAIARATAKYIATKGTEAAVKGGEKSSSDRKLAGALIGVLGNIAAAASEAADLRSWTTLPGAFAVGRLWLPPGQHKLEIEYLSHADIPTGRRESRTVDLKAGQRQILSIRTLE